MRNYFVVKIIEKNGKLVGQGKGSLFEDDFYDITRRSFYDSNAFSEGDYMAATRDGDEDEIDIIYDEDISFSLYDLLSIVKEQKESTSIYEFDRLQALEEYCYIMSKK